VLPSRAVQLPNNDPHGPKAPGDGRDTLEEVMGGFPRHLTTQLIEEGEVGRSRREVIGGLALGLGLAVFALAFPQERLIGQQAQYLDPADATVQFVIDQLRSLCSRQLGMLPEQLGFVLAALAYGACLPVSLSIARRQGCGFGTALVGSLAALLSPIAWVAGTTPGLEALALLFCLLALDSLWTREKSRPLMATAWWVLAAACMPAFAWLLPAVVWGGLRGHKKRVELGFSLPLIGAVLFLMFAMPVGVLVEVPEALQRLWRAMRFGGTGGWGQVGTWVVGVVPGLGLAVVGVGSLFLARRNESEEPPPKWLLLWCGLPTIALGLMGTADWAIPYLWLLPPALVGTCDLLARRSSDVGLGWTALILGLQVGTIGAVSVLLVATDPQIEWRRHARAVLRPDDHVVTPSQEHAYLLSNRWGLRCTLIESIDHGPDHRASYMPVSEDGELMLSSAKAVVPSSLLEGLIDSDSRRIALDASFPPHQEEYQARITRALEEHGEFLLLDQELAQ
jgi:hypothetical protein